MKQCKKCHLTQEYSQFPKHKKSKDGFENICKSCRKKSREGYMKLYREKNIEKLSKNDKIYRESNKEILKIKQKTYRENNREKIRKEDRERYHKNKIILNEKSRIYREKTKESHRQHRLEYARQYREKNRDTINLRIRKWTKLKIETDIIFKLKKVLRERVRGALKGIRKEETTLKLVGCGIEYLKQYLESKFLPGMTWENYGKDGWHIDHIIPCSTFDFNDQKQIKICFHYTNLRPLWAKDNLSRPKDGSDINNYSI